MLDQNIASEVLARATATGGDFAEIFLEDRIDHSVSMVSGKIETVSSGRLHGAGVRVFNGLNAIYVYTNDTSREGLMDCAAKAAAAIRSGKGCSPVGFSSFIASSYRAVLSAAPTMPITGTVSPRS